MESANFSRRNGLAFSTVDAQLFEPARRARLPATRGLLAAVALPPEAILPTPPLIRDQTDTANPGQDIPCCVSISLVQCMESLDLRAPPSSLLSPLYHYYAARSSTASLQPISIPDGIVATVSGGVCRLELHDPPMNPAGAAQCPSPQALQDAPNHRIRPYDTITWKGGCFPVDPASQADWRTFLASGYPLILGFRMTPAYDALAHADTHGSALGLPQFQGHAVTCLGYSNPRNAFHIKDSRGPGFGDQGWWWMPYDRLSEAFIKEVWAVSALTY